jgi:hypothetical protein
MIQLFSWLKVCLIVYADLLTFQSFYPGFSMSHNNRQSENTLRNSNRLIIHIVIRASPLRPHIPQLFPPASLPDRQRCGTN